MVRETRHLWVGNLPENIREDRIREHFKRYGRVQSVKLLPRAKEEEGSTGLCATVAFMDIKSASKAHNMEQTLDERCLSTEYYEPPIPGSGSAPLYVAPRFPHGVPEDHANFDRSSLFYERGREGDAYLRRPPASGYHVPGDPLRGRGRERLYRNGPLPYAQIIDRPPPPHHRPLVANAWNYEAPPSARYPVPPPPVEPYTEERREPLPVVHKKRPKSRSGSESASNSASSRSRSRSPSRSSSSSSNSRSSSCTSGTSSPVEGSPHSSRTARSGRVGGVAVQSTVSAPHTNNASPAVHSEDRRPLAICVRNLPIRSSDTSLKDGLFHEYKKHGKVTWVKVVGQGTDRYALVCFKKPEDVEKALEVSHDKLFFGCKIEVASYQGYDVDDNESRPYEAELDEYHPKATRTLFIGNLEKDVTASELRKHFEQFGEIIEIDIKKQGASSYAFCQYADIASVVKAMRTMDGEHLGNNRIKLGFGKSMPTNCVWVDGVADNVSEKYLNLQFNQFGSISHVTIDRERGHALIYFEQIPYAQEAVRDMRGVTQRGRKLQVDFASRECQETFYEHLEKQGHAVVGGERPWDRYDNNREVQASRFETTVVVPGARFTRYEAGSTPSRPRPPTAYVRTPNNITPVPVAAVGGAPPTGPPRGAARGQRTPGQRYTEYYDAAEYPERRYSRNYDEVSQGSPGRHEDLFDHNEYGYCPRTSPSAAIGERIVAVVADKSVLAEDEGYKRLQSVVVSDVISPPLPPPDMRHLQKERVHLLEQLEECPSSGDDDVPPKKRPKIVDPADIAMSSNCFDAANHDPPTLLMTTHNHRKSISEVRRLSDASLKHCPRRPSADGSSRLMDMPSGYAPHPVCKRRKTGSSASEGEDRCRKHLHHHHHHSGDLESVDGSRPGTPLCDERPENLLPPSEPRRPRDRVPEGPLSLPLPRFASQVLTSRILAGKPIIVSPPTITSPRILIPHPPPSPSPTNAPPPSSPPPRPPSLPSSSSSDSEQGPPSPTLEEFEERIRSLDERYEKWSGSRNITAPSETLAKLDAAGDRFRYRHKLLDLNELKPSDIVKSVLAKPSVFDEDSKRLENVGDKYEPQEFGVGCFQSLRIKTECGTPVKALPASPVSKPVPFPPRLMASSPLHSPNQPLPKSPFSTGTPTTPTATTPTTPLPNKVATIPKTDALSPRPAGTGLSAAQGLQYPFPSHPPVVPTTTVATTTATATNVIAVVSVSVSIPTTAAVTSFSEVSRTCVAKPIGIAVHQNDPRSRVAPPVMILTASTATKPSPEVTCRVQVPQRLEVLNSRISVCAKPNVTMSIPLTETIASEVFRTCPVKSVVGNVINCEPDVMSFPMKHPTTLTTPLVSVKKTCATTVALTLPPRISTAGITRPCSTPTNMPTTSVPSSPRFAAKTSEHSPKTYKDFNSLLTRPDSLQNTNIPTPPSDISLPPTQVSRAGIATEAITAVVTTATQTVSTSSTSTVTVSSSTTTVSSTSTSTSTPTNTFFTTTNSEQSRQSQKPKVTSNTKSQAPSKKELSQSFTPKKDREDSKTTCSHRSKSLEEKKDKKESASGVCQRRESEGTDRRIEKERRKERESNDAWENKRKEKDSEERKKEWESTEGERERKKDGSVEKDARKENVDSDRLGWNDKEVSDNQEKEKPRNVSAESLDKKKDFADERWRDNHPIENIVKERWKDKEGGVDKDKRKENNIDHIRDKEVNDSKVQLVTETLERRKDSDVVEHLDRRKDPDQPPDSSEKRKEKDHVENPQRRKSTDEKRKNRESPENVDRRKERELNHIEKRKDRDAVDTVDKKKERDGEGLERWKERESTEEKRKDRESEEKRKERRRERAASVNSPASIGCKRRISSQDSLENDESKRPKLPERRDSKDSGRSSSSSSKRGPHHSFAKPHDDKTKLEADRKHRHEHDKIRDKSKKKNRDVPKPGKETVEERETSTSPRLIKRKEDSDSDKEEMKHRQVKRESTEKKKMNKEDFIATAEFMDEKARSAKKDREKRGSSEKRKEDSQSPTKDDKLCQVKKEITSRIHKLSNSDTDTDDEDGPKKHSIFDVVDDCPPYISMYDKVKARSTKNMQKQEEEKRQEKINEKFGLLKASRAKREEKKRSTSWDEDSDSDLDPEVCRAKRISKAVISSSSEDESRREPRREQSYNGDELSVAKSIKKEDLGLGDSDSDSHHRKPVFQNDSDGNTIKHMMSAMRKGSRAKLISDTSDDDIRPQAFKPNNILELYSAESDADLGFADSDDRHPSYKKTQTKNHKLAKSVMDSLTDETIRKPISDISKCTKEKSASFKKTISKNKSLKGSVDWSDKEKVKIESDLGKTNFFDEGKLAAIFKPKTIIKNKTMKTSFNSSDEEHTRKILTDAVKAEIYGEDNKTSNFTTAKKFNKTKTNNRCLDSSDDELTRKLQSMTPKIEIKPVIKSKSIKSSPESHDEEVPRKFVSDADKPSLLGDIPIEKYNSHNKTTVLSTFSDVDQNSITPPQSDKKMAFFDNCLEKNSESSRKKAHKKKQKRLKESQSSEEVIKVRELQENHVDTKVKSEKKHKRERRKSDHGEDQNKINKIRKKKSVKPDMPKPESSLKRDEKMEDIFGPISDDSESGISNNKVLPTLHKNGGRPSEKLALPSKWQVSEIYSTDSDSVDRTARSIIPTPVRPTEKERKRRDKKRRDRKAREDDSVGAELAEAGRALEAKLLGNNEYLSSDMIKREPHEDVLRFSDGDNNLETSLEKAKEKEKKKKRKKSKEEKQNKHHHHHHHDKKSSLDGKVNVIPPEDANLPVLASPSLPSLEMIPNEVKTIPMPETLSVIPPTVNTVPCKISPRSLDKKKDKFIPGFGVAMDAAVHETAVKSISDFEAVKPEVPAKVEAPKKSVLPKEGDEADGEEEKPRAVISQEETEDAVAALLGESFGADFTNCYGNDGNGSPHHTGSGTNHPQLQTDEEEETRQAVEGLIDMKPDTPQSEPDLQIDTDTEEDDSFLGHGFSDDNPSRSSDNIDFSKPPKTPDMPASYYRQQQLKAEAELPTIVKITPSPEIVVVPPSYPKPLPAKVDAPESPVIPKPVESKIPQVEINKKVIAEQKKEGVKEVLPVQVEVKVEEAKVTPVMVVEKKLPQEIIKPISIAVPPKLPVEIPTISPVIVDKPVIVKKEETPVKPVLPETSKETLPPLLPSVIKAPSPPPVNVLSESVIKCQDLPKDDVIIKERVPFLDNIIKDFKPYRFDDPPMKKDHLLIKDDNKLINNIDFGRLDKPKDTENDLNQEDDFSEPENDLKTESDIVTNLLKSDSLTRGLSIDDSTPETEKVETVFEPFIEKRTETAFEPSIEKKTETVSVIKEIDSHRLPELDPFPSTKQINIPKDPLTLLKENHSDFMTDVIRADTGFWSAKEVNIDSVIKKVDALCSAEEDVPDQEPWFPPKEEHIVPEVAKPDSPKIQSIETNVKVIVPEEVKIEEEPIVNKIEPAPLTSTPEKETENLDVPVLPERARSEERLSTLETEMTPDVVERVVSGSSPEDEQSESVTPRGSQRGRRGVGGKRRTPSRAAANITTRQTRLAQKQPDDLLTTVPPRRGGRPPKGSSRSTKSDKLVDKTPLAVFDFTDESEEEDSGDKNRPRLLLTIKSPVSGAPNETTSKLTNSIDASAKATIVIEHVGKPTVNIEVKPIVSVEAASKPVISVEPASKVSVEASNEAASKATSETAGKAVETNEDLSAAPAANTRKSRRLQVNNERDGSRTTIDDTIEDVVRGAAPLTRAAAANLAATTRRQAKQNNVLTVSPRALEPRKSPRGGKRQTLARTSESQDESDNKAIVEEPPTPKPAEPVIRDVEKTEVVIKEPENVPKVIPKTVVVPPGMMLKPRVPGENLEPMTLIDPVTGLLIPMRESEEGQYIPVTSAGIRSLSESVDSGVTSLAARARVQNLPVATIPAQVPVISKSPIPPPAVAKPVLQAVPQVVQQIIQPIAEAVPVQVVKAPVLPPLVNKTVPQNVPVVQTIVKPALPTLPVVKTVVPSLPVNLQVSKPQITVAPMKTAVVQPQIKITTPPTYPLNKVKVTVAPSVHPKVTPMPNSPKPHLHQASSAVSPSQVMPQQAHMNKIMLQHPGVANPMANQKPAHMLQAPRPASPAVHATASPPKAHQGLGPPPILTGAVASPPLKLSQQPVVTGASSSRAVISKAQVPNLPTSHLSPHGKNMMIPPKVEVSMGGCIVVPSASPQPRNQVLQAGMPIPAYEASLGDVVQHVFPHSLRGVPHEMPPHYGYPSLMYHQQQYLRAAHIPYPLDPEAESEEAQGCSPPLELRRPTSGGARVSHSLQSPHDRLTDSPQVATVYMHASRIPHYTPRYYEPEPPPAHVRTNRHHPLPGTEAPPVQAMLQVSTPPHVGQIPPQVSTPPHAIHVPPKTSPPPHASQVPPLVSTPPRASQVPPQASAQPHTSQVPPQANSLKKLLPHYPVMWQGLLGLKTEEAKVQMHFVFGNPEVARDSLPCNPDGSTMPLRISQRMRLEQTQLEGVARKMQMDNECCLLLALPCGDDHKDVLQQSHNLEAGFITYLQEKQAAGIASVNCPVTQQAAYVVHIFPSCDFVNEYVARYAPELLHRVANFTHLLIVIATV